MSTVNLKYSNTSYECFIVTAISLTIIFILMQFTNHWILFWIFVGLVYFLSNSKILKPSGSLF